MMISIVDHIVLKYNMILLLQHTYKLFIFQSMGLECDNNNSPIPWAIAVSIYI
jgi:hypothetical protein